LIGFFGQTTYCTEEEEKKKNKKQEQKARTKGKIEKDYK
tara:strand:+ start:359 stop:475 length:117 start_codon:yes stop_codon:yes gene_type:complete